MEGGRERGRERELCCEAMSRYWGCLGHLYPDTESTIRGPGVTSRHARVQAALETLSFFK